MPFLLLFGVIASAWVVARVRLSRHQQLERELERRTARDLARETARQAGAS